MSLEKYPSQLWAQNCFPSVYDDVQCVLVTYGRGAKRCDMRLAVQYSPGCQLSAGTSDFVTIWDLLVTSASASADPYIFRVISYQCPAQCLLLIVLSRDGEHALCGFTCVAQRRHGARVAQLAVPLLALHGVHAPRRVRSDAPFSAVPPCACRLESSWGSPQPSRRKETERHS